MTKTHTVTIDGKEYEFDVEKAVKEGFLREIPDYPLNSGDVYVSSKGYRPSLLIRPFYNEEKFIISGNDGVKPFASAECQKLLSKKEVIDIFTIEGYKFSHNINEKVMELIENP